MFSKRDYRRILGRMQTASLRRIVVVSTLHCPQCSQPLDQQQQEFRRRGVLLAVVTLLTCRHEGCEAYGRTTTERHILNPEQLAAWGFTPKYDLYTGEEVCRV